MAQTGSSTVFLDQQGSVNASWLNDVNSLVYNFGGVAWGSIPPNYTDTGVVWQSSAQSGNNYTQTILQNTNAGANASAGYVVNNDKGTATTFYGEFGINSSGFTGSPVLNQPSYVYLTSTSTDLVIGTTTSNGIHFVVNNGTTDAISVSSSGAVTIPNLIGAGGGVQNKVMNGAMRRDALNLAASITPTATAFIIDRWAAAITQASKLTFQQVADAPPGFKYSIKATVASQFSPGASDQFVIRQGIEGQMMTDLQFGIASASSVIIQFWSKHSITGTYSVSLTNSTNTRSYVTTYTHAVSGTWQLNTLTVSGDVTGTWASDNSLWAYLAFDLGSGSTATGTAGAWAASTLYRATGAVQFVNQANSSTFQISGIAIYTGTSAPSSYVNHIGIFGADDTVCQRYHPTFNSDSSTSIVGASSDAKSTTVIQCMITPFTPPRIAPTGVTASGAAHLTFTCAAGSFISSAIAIGSSTSVNGFLINNTTSGATAGQAGVLFFNTSSGQLRFTGAEL